jgi:hypothetical protein
MMDHTTPSVHPQDASSQPVSLPGINEGKFNPMRALIRLAIGSVELGAENLLHRLERLEAQPPPAGVNSEPTSAIVRSEPAGAPPEQIESSQLALARYITIGAIFDAQERLERGLIQFGRAGNAVNRLATRASKPLRWIPGVKPLGRSIDRLAARGEQEVARWIKLGRQEEQESKEFAERVIIDTLGEYFQYLADHPAVEELVEEQSTGLATEVVEEVRERAVSLDTFLEGFARAMLRRTPRSRLPLPPAPVRMSANTLRSKPEVKGKAQ